MLLALTMLPAVGLRSAYADEPAARPATTGGDVALEGAAETAPVTTQRDDGTLVADGLVYAAIDGGLLLVGFDGPPEGEDAVKDITVPASVSIDGEDMPVVAIDIAEGQTADSVVSLTLPQSINNVSTATLAAAFPNLAAIEVAAPKASAPVAAGAAAMRAAYSSFGGVLYRNAWVATDDASQTTLKKELVWAPPATVVARIPVECTSIAAGAFTDVKDLKTVVCFGVMESIAQTQKAEGGTVTLGAFTDEQVQTANVIVPQTGTVVPNGDHVSASVAVTDDSTMDIKREAWWKSGFASDRITLGEVYGSTTNTLPVTEEGVLEVSEAEVAYAPETTQNSSSRKAGIEPPESAIPTPVPDDDELDPSESGLVFTHLADMTLSVSWKGDPTATPSHLDIPAYATINGVAYPVTEIAPNAFKGAVFLTSITIPEAIKTVGAGAFDGCTNLPESEFPSGLSTMADTTSVEISTLSAPSKGNGADRPTPSQSDGSLVFETVSGEEQAYGDSPLSSYAASLTFTKGYKFTVEVTIKNALWNGVCQSWDSSLGTGKVDDTDKSKTIFTINIPDQASYVGIRGYGYNGNSPNGLHLYTFFRDANKDLLKSGAVVSYHDGSSSYVEYSSNFIGADNSEKTYAVGDLVGRTFTETITAFRNQAEAIEWGVMTKRELSSFKNGPFKNLLEAYDKFANSFGRIVYVGLDGNPASSTNVLGDSVFPQSYQAGLAPSLPTPERAGYNFTGWKWSRANSVGADQNPTDQTSDVNNAFAYAGDVTLKAMWEQVTPEANYFYTESDPYKGDKPSHTILVRLAAKQDGETQKSLSSVSFSKKDGAPLGSNADGVTFKVGGSAAVGWDADAGSVALEESGGYWCARITVTVPSGAIDPSKVASSYVDSSYVASLAKMSYEFA